MQAKETNQNAMESQTVQKYGTDQKTVISQKLHAAAEHTHISYLPPNRFRAGIFNIRFILRVECQKRA